MENIRDFIGSRLIIMRIKGETMNRTYISGGMIYDGTGGDPFCGDIVINGSKIEEVLSHRTDRFTGTEGPLIHAEGLAVTPGFVDVL